MTDLTPTRIILLATAQAVLAATGCINQSHPTDGLDPDALRWVSYTNQVAGYGLDHPEAMQERSEGGSLLLRLGAHAVPVVVRFTTEEDGRRRGAWFGHPAAGTATLAGRPAQVYDYTHWDGPFGGRTVSYVIPWHDRWLGLEFRTPDDLSPVQQRILDSFHLDD